MKIHPLIPHCLMLCVLALTGCETTSGGAVYTDAKGPNGAISLNQINARDFDAAASKFVDSIKSSGVLERAPKQPVLLAISRIVNNTQQQIDTDELMKKIRVLLLNSGKVETTTTLALGGKVEDPMAKALAERERLRNGEAQQSETPYATLSGKLLERRARDGDIRQVTYSFQLSLTTVANGRAVWEDEFLVSIKGTRPSVGL